MATTAEVLTWEMICELEPGMEQLYQQAESIRDDERRPRFCANKIWYRHFKPLVVWRVGRQASIPALKSSLAYDIACDKIYNALPNCRNCSCLGMGND